MNPDQLARLEDERKFLLRSLADLERERAAGDVDDDDYVALRDGYTVRAAATLRAIEAGRAALPERVPVNWPRRIGTAGFVVLVTAVVWWALSASSAQRLPGQQISGLDPRDREQQLLAEARAIQNQQPDVAAELYQSVLDEDPSNVEALTYRGWTLAIDLFDEPDSDVVAAQLRESVELLSEAIEVDPTYPDPYCFLGIVQGRFLGRPDAAIPFVDRCLEQNPPAEIRGLVEAFRASLAESTDESSDEAP